MTFGSTLAACMSSSFALSGAGACASTWKLPTVNAPTTNTEKAARRKNVDTFRHQNDFIKLSLKAACDAARRLFLRITAHMIYTATRCARNNEEKSGTTRISNQPGVDRILMTDQFARRKVVGNLQVLR